MAELSDGEYLAAHQRLKHLWTDEQDVYADLSPAEQWQLHDYFKPSKDLTAEALLTHRQEITEKRTGLAGEAVEALTEIEYALELWKAEVQRRASAPRPAKGKRGSSKNRQISVRAVVRPEPDVQMMARALISLARQMAAEAHSRAAPPADLAERTVDDTALDIPEPEPSELHSPTRSDGLDSSDHDGDPLW